MCVAARQRYNLACCSYLALTVLIGCACFWKKVREAYQKVGQHEYCDFIKRLNIGLRIILKRLEPLKVNDHGQ